MVYSRCSNHKARIPGGRYSNKYSLYFDTHIELRLLLPRTSPVLQVTRAPKLVLVNNVNWGALANLCLASASNPILPSFIKLNEQKFGLISL
jgi:hypothetical protein